MIDVDKVIKGLECCATNRLRREDCEEVNCSYLDLEGNGCIHQLIRDANALLKAQEPPTSECISSAIECLLHPQDADDSDMAKAIDTAVRAMRLLKAQEPRVMTLEYFDNSPDKDSEGCLVAWVEYRRDEEWAEYWEGTCDEWSVIRRDDFYSGESYRFWTSRPTDEQREATPWA